MKQKQCDFDPDSVRGIVDHMNEDHAEALRLYVDTYTDIPGDSIAELKMIDIDAEGICMSYVRGGETGLIRILFVDTIGKSLGSVAGVRGALVAMAKRARGQ